MKNDRPIRVLWWKYQLLINKRNEYKSQNTQWSMEEICAWNQKTESFVKERSQKIKELRKLL
jgi:hypothetical protein